MIFFFYQFVIFILLLLSPIIFLIRVIKKKEDLSRILEKLSIPSKNRYKGKLIWFHAASVGELMSIVPLIKSLELNKEIKTILITTSTLSSAKIFKKLNLKKSIHQFFPIDFLYFNNRFLNYWKPEIAIFIDSEIWPSTFSVIKKKSIKLLLLNARITNKSFNRWNKIRHFAEKIFSKIDIAYPQNNETKKFLKKLNVNKLKELGNLKFTEIENKKNIQFQKKFKSQIQNKLIFCAASTHPNEEILIAKVHKSLKKRIDNLLTIIIPRHIDRSSSIKKELVKLQLNSIIKSSKEKILDNTDIFIVDSYGETKKFFNISDIVFMGGSIVKHGGQNPIEPARFGLNIIHGPNISNFKDIYDFFAAKGIAFKIYNKNQLIKITSKLLSKKNRNSLNLKKIGNIILENTLKELNYEIEKA